MRWRGGAIAVAAGAGAGSAQARPPMSYLETAGPAADPATALTWWLLVVSCAVIVIMAAAVAYGVWTRRSGAPATAISEVGVARRGDGVRWIWIGVAVSSVFLLVSVVWTVAALGAVAHPANGDALTIEVTGAQWWWKARYDSPDPQQVFETANELHIPVGRPVRVKLLSADVIHSFWVPALAGKTDAIPGRENLTWLQADHPGRYRGQCTEYCGQQHAHMVFTVVAEPPMTFERWRQAQLRPAPPPPPGAGRGRQIVENRCGACHTIRGTDAGGSTAPDLTHLMSREWIAAGAVRNTPGGLSGWIANPQGVKPGAHMPTLYLSGPELSDVRSYLLTLK